MNRTLKYKGFYTNVEMDFESKILHGKIEGINDLVTFESSNMETIEEEFHNAVEEYISFCKTVGKEPEKSLSGTFNVRVNPTLHRWLSMEAASRGMSLNAIVERALEQFEYREKKIEEGLQTTQIHVTYNVNDIKSVPFKIFSNNGSLKSEVRIGA